MSEEKLPTGVTSHWNKYKAQYWHKGRHYLGLFSTVDAAVKAIHNDCKDKNINPLCLRKKKNPD